MTACKLLPRVSRGPAIGHPPSGAPADETTYETAEPSGVTSTDGVGVAAVVVVEPPPANGTIVTEDVSAGNGVAFRTLRVRDNSATSTVPPELSRASSNNSLPETM